MARLKPRPFKTAPFQDIAFSAHLKASSRIEIADGPGWEFLLVIHTLVLKLADSGLQRGVHRAYI